MLINVTAIKRGEEYSPLTELKLLSKFGGNNQMSNNAEVKVMEKVIYAYFGDTDKSLREIFEEYTEDLSEDEKEVFFVNLRSIVN